MACMYISESIFLLITCPSWTRGVSVKLLKIMNHKLYNGSTYKQSDFPDLGLPACFPRSCMFFV